MAWRLIKHRDTFTFNVVKKVDLVSVQRRDAVSPPQIFVKSLVRVVGEGGCAGCLVSVAGAESAAPDCLEAPSAIC